MRRLAIEELIRGLVAPAERVLREMLREEVHGGRFLVVLEPIHEFPKTRRSKQVLVVLD